MNKESNVSPKTSNDCSLHLPRVRENGLGSNDDL